MSTKKTVILTTADALDKLTISVGKQAHKLAADIQIALASGAFFAAKDGNVEPANALILVMGRGTRKTAAADWILKFMPVNPNTDSKTNKDRPFVFSRDKYRDMLGTEDNKNVSAEDALNYAEQAYGTMWTDLKEPPLVPEEYDVMAQLAMIAKKADSLQGKGTKIVHPELLEFVRRMATKAAVVVAADVDTEDQTDDAIANV
jgi:hypothetical protein